MAVPKIDSLHNGMADGKRVVNLDFVQDPAALRQGEIFRLKGQTAGGEFEAVFSWFSDRICEQPNLVQSAWDRDVFEEGNLIARLVQDITRRCAVDHEC